MVEAFRQWRVYVEGGAHPLRVYTDHKNLEDFSTTKTASRRHAKWAASLTDLLPIGSSCHRRCTFI